MGTETLKTGYGVSITISPTRAEMRKKLAQIKRMMGDAEPAMKGAATFLDRWVQTNFKTQGKNLSDGPWPPFSPKNRRKILDPTAKLLQDTGRLRLSFTPFATKDNAGIGSDLDYAETHEKGIGVPQRRMLPRKPEVIGDIEDIMNRWAKKVTEAANA